MLLMNYLNNKVRTKISSHMDIHEHFLKNCVYLRVKEKPKYRVPGLQGAQIVKLFRIRTLCFQARWEKTFVRRSTTTFSESAPTPQKLNWRRPTENKHSSFIQTKTQRQETSSKTSHKLTRFCQVRRRLQQYLWTVFEMHTYAKLIKIQKNYLQKIHGLHELGSHMECNDTLRGFELGLHWGLGPKNSKLVPWEQKNLLNNFFTQRIWGTMWLFCGVLKPK